MILELSLFLTFLRLIGTKKHFYDNNNNKNNKSSLRKRERFFLARTRNSFFCPKIEAFCQRDIPMKRSFYISISLSLSLSLSLSNANTSYISYNFLALVLSLSHFESVWPDLAKCCYHFGNIFKVFEYLLRVSIWQMSNLHCQSFNNVGQIFIVVNGQ